jgi:tetratricopeptide (TPR) repeat protein
MSRKPIFAAVLVAFALSAGVAQASWYDDYDDGIKAARAGNWSVVAAKMSSAIKGNGTESNKARTYGAIFINYHPYYYRGVANLNLGRYEQAVADLEKTSGPGAENLGSIGELIDRAKKQMASASEPEPTPTPTRPAPVAPTPAAPQIDPALTQRASTSLRAANDKLRDAQTRRATASPQYAQALTAFNDATARFGNADSNDDYTTIINLAERASDLAELAMPPNVPAPTPTPSNPIAAPAPVTPTPTRPAMATDVVLADYRRQLRRALENYFNGEFDDASKDFADLTTKLPSNGWIWAFLGASQYSQYAFEADESYRAAAVKSFRKAKALRTFKGGLPDKYFSRRIRRAFNEEG